MALPPGGYFFGLGVAPISLSLESLLHIVDQQNATPSGAVTAMPTLVQADAGGLKPRAIRDDMQYRVISNIAYCRLRDIALYAILHTEAVSRCHWDGEFAPLRLGFAPLELSGGLRLMEEKNEDRLLTSMSLRNFVKAGGRLKFVPFVDSRGRHCWEMYGVYPDGHVEPVIEGRRSQPRIVRTARGVVAYWRLYHPEDRIVPVPVLPDGKL